MLLIGTQINLLILWCWQWHFTSALLLYQPQSQSPQLLPSPQAQQQQQQQQQAQPVQVPNGPSVIPAIADIARAFKIADQTAHGGAGQTNGTTGSINNFVMKIIHNDSKNNLSYVSIQPVPHTNLYEPRIELRYQSKQAFVTIDERTPNNTVVAAVVVFDDDEGQSGVTSLSIEHGNELGHFKIVNTQYSNTIQVSGAPLYKQRVPEYNLTIVARDHGSPPKSSAVNLVIKLSTSHNAPPEPLQKPPVSDYMYVGTMLVVLFAAFISLVILGCALVQRPKSKKGPINTNSVPWKETRLFYCHE